MIQYRYAATPQNTLIDVLTLNPDDRAELGPFTCVGCGNPMIAKLGNRREKHFAHKQQVVCTGETYLHRLGKYTFYEVYQRCLDEGTPFEIELRHTRACTRFESLLHHTCIKNTVKKTYDLTAHYREIKLEQRDGQFIPDVLLVNPQRPSENIYVEIAVTHFLSEAKATSAHRIIELPIDDESGIGPILQRYITEEQARFVNFRRGPINMTDGECTCADTYHTIFVVYRSGKSFFDSKKLRDIPAFLQRNGESIIYSTLNSTGYEVDLPIDRGSRFVGEVEHAYRRGFPIKNCFICRFMGDNYRETDPNPIFCRRFKKSCTSNAATDCGGFWVREDLERKKPK